jgi:SAM-dependent methyltransferase
VKPFGWDLAGVKLGGVSLPAEDLDRRRASFLSAADDYERFRPRYPVHAIRWVVGDGPKTILDVGCGPGNLTSQLAELGHVVVGIDPSMTMLQGMAAKGLSSVRGVAEALPVLDGCCDIVTAATAFHWFDHEKAVPEMRRVLRSGGRLGLFTNIRDESVSWVAALSTIIGSEAAMSVTLGGVDGMEEHFVAKLEGQGFFTATQHRIFDFEQLLTEDALVGLVKSRSYVAILSQGERERLLMQVRSLCRDHPDLHERDTFVMPYRTYVYRAIAW